MAVYTREYLHKPTSIYTDPRGGIHTADHVDIMGNHGLIEDILSIVTDDITVRQDLIHSSIKELSKSISDNLSKVE